jgi:alpha-tubulin suppressor-like RCC1 family protein
VLGLLAVGFLIPACGIGGGGTLTPTVAPQVPGDLSTFSGNGQVTLQWSSQAAGATFTVKRSFTRGGPYFPVSTPAGFTSSTSYVDAGLTNGSTYFYVVSSTNAFGNSADSSEVQGTPGFKGVVVASGPSAYHSLVVLQDQALWGFGDNSGQELGSGRVFSSSAVPVHSVGMTGVVAAAAGEYFSLALRNDGTVWSWGVNSEGELGIGSTSNTPVGLPGPVQGLSRVTGISAGLSHSLALRNDGTVWVWGGNTRGQLGNGTSGTNFGLVPAPVPGLSGIRAIAAGESHNLALAPDGTVWAWGDNTFGQLGVGTSSTTPVTSPVQVMNLNGVVALAAGKAHSVALRLDGSVWSWGANGSSQLGNLSPLTLIAHPVTAQNVASIVAVAASAATTFALRSDGTVMAWGYNAFSNCGLGNTNTTSPIPTMIPGLASVRSIAAGVAHALCLLDDGTVVAWGRNSEGEVGNGLGIAYDQPTLVPNFTPVQQVCGGFNHTVALLADGSVWTWGDNSSGQLGFGPISSIPSSTPFQVPGLSGVIWVAAGGSTSLAVKGDGTVWGWGSNGNGQLGSGVAVGGTSTTPVKIQGLSGVFTRVTAGAIHTLALRNDGTVWGWGDNSAGSLGNGVLPPLFGQILTTPVQAVGLPNVAAVVTGARSETSMALGIDGSVWTWGWNQDGEVGNGDTTTTSIPTPQKVLTGGVSIATDSQHSLAVKADGTVWEWGVRTSVPPGSPPPSNFVPAQVTGIDSVATVTAGELFTIALRNDGTVWAWGANSSGMLGHGDEVPHAGPVQVLGLAGPTQISAGSSHGLAVMPSGLLYAWGSNLYLALGIPAVNIVLTPSTVRQ